MEDEEQLQQEVTELRAQLEALQAGRRELQTKVRQTNAELEAKEKRLERQARKQAEEQTLSMEEAEIKRLQDLTKLYRIFGFEVVSSDKNGVAAAFPQWHNGVCSEQYSVAVRKTSHRRLEVVKHTMPPGTADWLEKVPCQVPQHTSMPALLRELKTSVSSWFHRSQQLKELRAKNPELQVLFPVDLSTILVVPKLKDTNSLHSVKFEVELKYSSDSPFPTSFSVAITDNNTDEANEVLEEQMTQQCEPFQSMELAEAFYFCFLAKDDTTRRTFVAE